jgi:hypothetical protein
MNQFQVFEVRATWKDYGEDGRRADGCTFMRMPRENTTLEQVEIEAREVWWPEYRNSLKYPSRPTINVSFLGWETWCGGWFTHWAYDLGQSDKELLESFREFVDRKSRQSGYCLMGAEDRWRWSARDRSLPPCRCEDCKKLGIVRIDH